MQGNSTASVSSLELLRELVPAATRISFLAYAGNPRSIPRATAIEALARPLGMRVTARVLSGAWELETAFATSAADHDQAMMVQLSPSSSLARMRSARFS